MAGLCARIRLYWLFTVVLVPVDQEYPGQSVRKQPHQVASKAREMESPVEAIELGSAGAALAPTVVAASPSPAPRIAISLRRRCIATSPQWMLSERCGF